MGAGASSQLHKPAELSGALSFRWSCQDVPSQTFPDEVSNNKDRVQFYKASRSKYLNITITVH